MSKHIGQIRITMEMIKHIMLLPDEYDVVTAHIDANTNELRVIVDSPTLPR